jgi:hypothetical protein
MCRKCLPLDKQLSWRGVDSMSHRPQNRGRRSKGSKLRRRAKQYVLRHGFHDVIWAETICRTDRVEVHNYVHVTYPDLSEGMLLSDIPDYAEKGLVLVDSRGRGALQQ